MQYVGLEEHQGPIDLKITGSIPAWAAGSLFRTGPGQNALEGTSRGTFETSHWFDGLAQTHRFDIIPPETADGGSAAVHYSSRRQKGDVVKEIMKQGWQSSTSFAQRADPCIGIFAKAMSYFQPRRPNNNVVILPSMPGMPEKDTKSAVATNLVVTTDSAVMQQLDPETLEPIGSKNQTILHPDLKGPVSCAHAQRDPETGDLFNFNLDFGYSSVYRVFRVNAASGTTDILATFSGPEHRPAYIHSFFLTENYVVLCLPSAHFGWGGLKLVWERNVLDAIKPFDKTQPCRWVVIDRRHGKGIVAKFSTPAGFLFHTVNAFEDNIVDANKEKHTELCLDYIAYNNLDIMFNFYYDIILDRKGATKKYMLEKEKYKTSQHRMVRRRFRMPPHGHTQTAEEARNATADEVISIPSPHAGELPSIHPRLIGKPYRYVYSTNTRGLSTFMDSLVKTDVDTREALIWSGAKGHSPGEPIFVPRPGATDEDDGVVLAVVLDGSAQRSYLLCLDAKTMEELGRAEAEFAIAMSLHGSHQPSSKI